MFVIKHEQDLIFAFDNNLHYAVIDTDKINGTTGMVPSSFCSLLNYFPQNALHARVPPGQHESSRAISSWERL